MGPEKRPCRPASKRPGAPLGAALIVGMIWLHASRAADASVPQEFESRVDPPASMSLARQDTGASGAVPGGSTPFEVYGMLSRVSAAERLGDPAPEPARFTWPAPLEVSSGFTSPLPRSLDLMDWTDLRAELAADVCRRCVHDPWAEIGDAVLGVPERLFNGIVNCVGGWLGRSALGSWEDEENRSVTARILDIQFGPRTKGIFAEFLEQWARRERKYLSGVQESRAEPVGLEQIEDDDLGELLDDQRKILWDALRRTYSARYRIQLDEQAPKDARRLDQWTPVDFVVLPPLIAGYLYYRGISGKISMGRTALRLSIEPLSEFIRPEEGVPMIAALEWTVKGFPLGFIVSVGLEDGRYGVDFIGIGTSIGAARNAVEGRVGVEPP